MNGKLQENQKNQNFLFYLLRSINFSCLDVRFRSKIALLYLTTELKVQEYEKTSVQVYVAGLPQDQVTKEC